MKLVQQSILGWGDEISCQQNIKSYLDVLFAHCLVACTAQGLDTSAESSEVLSSDTGAVVQTVSDAGGASIEADYLLPEAVKAIKAPNKEDYPGWDSPDINGAEPLTRYFIDSFLYGYSTGFASLVEKFYDPDECEECAHHVNRMLKNKGNNEYFDHGYPAQIHSIEPISFDEENETLTILQKFNLPAYKKYSNGRVDKEYPEKLYSFYVQLLHQPDGWKVISVQYEIDEL